ncbi:MAG: hypothetical protein EA402_04870 [Planctomycetota bacterium]|nr:MAG: hypothetical protein EA402_04870 [Planctomycetota bacterium]
MDKDPTSFFGRWWRYLHERFPLHQHGPLIVVFSFCAVSFSSARRGAGWPDPAAVAVAAVSSLCFFLQLRIADEFKDAAEDRRWRPYRPVPRGLVSLRGLAMLFAISAALQLALALWWSPLQVIVLLIAWAYLAAMSFEFGCREWLNARPVTYLLSHMLIMPIVDFYGTACDWAVTSGRPPSGLVAFLGASFATGLVIELGRKIRSPEREEEGVRTYSVLWGPRRAVAWWWVCVAFAALLGCLAAYEADVLAPTAAILIAGAGLALLMAWRFARAPVGDAGKRIELAAGLWTLLIYATLGLVPQL